MSNRVFGSPPETGHGGHCGGELHGGQTLRVPPLFDLSEIPWEPRTSGNDDAGQMSAWYIFSSLGFYPVTPGSLNYALGSPLIKEAVIHLENGEDLSIIANNQSKENIYVKSVTVNGITIKENLIFYHLVLIIKMQI